MGSYKYFLFSAEQLNQKNEILKKVGKAFEPGIVVVNGTRKKFTQISDTATMDKFIDTVVVAQGDVDKLTYTKPQNVARQGV